MPLAAHAVFEAGDTLHLRAAWGEPEGASNALVQVEARAPVGSLAQAEALGAQVVQLLRAGGARGTF